MKFPAVCMCCPNRSVGCRSVCPLYAEAKKAYEAEMNTITAEKERLKDINRFRREGMLKNIRRK